MRLEGKVAIVTGAGSGMGEAIAHTFANEGALVAVLDVDEANGGRVAGAIGARARFVRCDVTNKADIDAAVAATERAFGRLDILINNAGASHINKPLLDIGEAEFERVFAVNVKGVFLFAQAAVPLMRRGGGGAIINIGSTAGLRPRPGLSAYNATKGAVHNLTKTLAVELAPARIRVCAIAPVATDTPLLPTFLGAADGQREKFIATVPLGRLAQPQDIANVALFLASDEAAFLTGNIVEVDGGRCV
ncbi:MAG: SDR family oxidoreductase [Pseudorhodoplanes sp.]|nr:MAG: SDR family oxidoreductase [Pseudorhodoplanes sp.]